MVTEITSHLAGFGRIRTAPDIHHNTPFLKVRLLQNVLGACRRKNNIAASCLLLYLLYTVAFVHDGHMR